MVKNIGSSDKIIRITVGVAFIVFGYLNESWWGAIGIVPLFTALIGWCPAYAPFKFSTIKKNNN